MIKTEWDIQEELTTQFLKERGVTLNQRSLFFIAKEVMAPSWLTNDKDNKWNEPSIDFVFVDDHGHIWLIELKKAIKTPLQAWLALCQVSHRAIELKKSYSFEKLKSAYLSTQSNGNSNKSDLLTDHKIYFDLSIPVPTNAIQNGPFHRVVAAKIIEETFSDVKSHFSNSNIFELQNQIKENYKVNNSREFKRFLEITENEWESVSSVPPEEWLLVD